MILAPRYYRDFKCISDSCLHNCCIGWEIDIDSRTAEYYNSLEGKIGNKIRENITLTDGECYFSMDEQNRCPLLDKNGLCEIISTLGEEALCNICRDHPRFKNFFDSHTEVGLGMCCEEAVRIILHDESDFELCVISGDESTNAFNEDENDFFETRNLIFGILNNKNQNLKTRVDAVLNEFGIDMPSFDASEWHDELCGLERLDSSWDKYLDCLNKNENTDFSLFDDDKWQNIIRNLIFYFLYRHLPRALQLSDYQTYIAFALVSTAIICKMFLNSDDQSVGCFEDICRMYSSEIEYSDENTDEMLFATESML